MKKLGFFCALCASVLSANTVFATEGALSGKFSINDKGDKVQFSQGNLQYQASSKTWRFAAKQYEHLGATNAKISASNSGWIDLFAWGTGNNPASASSDYSKYASFKEWGANAISNGGKKANAWRTLTRNEWVYIFTGRKNAAKLLGAGTVNGVKGIIILPDDWAAPAGITFNASESKGLMLKGSYYKNANGDNFAHNTYSAEQWTKMEAAGAVFLPVTGYRIDADVRKAEENGSYWTSDIYLNDGVDEGEAKNLDFDKGYVGFGMSGRGMGFAVRLVCKAAAQQSATAAPQPEAQKTAENGALKGQFTINDKGAKVQFSQGNLQYQASSKTWRFAAKQYEHLGATNAKISASNSGWIDLFAWGTGNNPTSASSDYSKYASFKEWGANAISNGGKKANAWRTLTRNEWVYIFTGRKNAAKLLGAGTVNGVKGIIILPDDWAAPAGITFNASESKGLMLKGSYYKNANGDNFAHNTYSAEQWTKMEAAGAVFLPVTGYRIDADVRKAEENGSYWTSDMYLNDGVDEGEAKNLDFDKGYVGFGMSGRGMGFAVRLVRVVDNAKAAPAPAAKQPVKR